MKKKLHVLNGLNNSVVYQSNINFLNEFFSNENNDFLLLCDKNVDISKIQNKNNIIIIQNNKIKSLFSLYFLSKDYQYIIIHSIIFSYIQQFIIFIFLRKLFKKIIWISWGGDLYEWKKKYDKYFIKNIIVWIKNKIGYIFRSKIQIFVGIFQKDIEFYKNEFKNNHKTFLVSYVLYDNPIYKKDYSFYFKTHKKDFITILIGHQSNPILNHQKVLKDLYKFKDEKFKLIIPISYGDMNNARDIENLAKKIFNKRAYLLKNNIPYTEYISLLSSVDIAIFNTNRQIALGNIYPLIYMGKKMFFPEQSVFYSFFKENEIEIEKYSLIENGEYSEIIQPINSLKNHQKIQKIVSLERKIQTWKFFFENI